MRYPCHVGLLMILVGLLGAPARADDPEELDLSAIPGLVKSLQHPKEEVRIEAARELVAYQERLWPETPDLIRALKDPVIRWDILKILMDIIADRPEESGAAIRAVGDLLTDRNPEIRQYAARTLKLARREAAWAVPKLIAALKDEGPAVRSDAAYSLGDLGTDAKLAVPALMETLKDRSESPGCSGCEIGMDAARALGRMGRVARPALPALRAMLHDKHPGRRAAACQALRDLGLEAREAIPELIACVQDREDYVRAYAVQALGTVGVGVRGVFPHVLAAARDEDDLIRLAALRAIPKFGAGARAAIPFLMQELRSNDAIPANPPFKSIILPPNRIAEEAAQALYQVGIDHPAVLMALRQAIKDGRPCDCLGDTTPGSACEVHVPSLMDALDDPDERARRWALRLLGRLGARSKEAVPAIESRLTDREEEVAFEAAHALGQLGRIAQQAAPALRAACTDRRSRVRASAAVALFRVTGQTSEALPVLLKILEGGPDDRGLEYASEQIGDMGEAAQAAVPALVRLLADPTLSTAWYAMRSLWRIKGARAREAVPFLIHEVKARNSGDWQRAAALLKAIDPEAARRLRVR